MEMNKPDPNMKLLHTLLRGDVHDRLLNLAYALQTGRGHWDFGVAIERLLDSYEFHERIAELEARLDIIESQDSVEETNKEKKDENPLGLVGKRFRRDDKNGKNN